LTKSRTSRAPKRLALLFLALVVVVLVAAPIALWVLLDPAELKARAAAYVKESTGRDLTISGPVTLSFFPWLGGVVKTASLAPPAGFGDAPFATIDELDLKVKAMPLLSGDIVIDTVRLKGARLRLETRRDGRTTWDGLIPAAATGEPSAETTSRPRLLQVAGLELRDGEIVWSDEAGGRYELKEVELTTGPLGGGEPSDGSLSFMLSGLGREPVPVTMKGRMTLDAATSRVLIEAVQAKIDQSTVTGSLTSDPGAGREALRTWRGDLTIDKVRAYGVTASDVKTRIEAKGGTATIGPATGRFYGGQYGGTFTIDARGREPVVRVDQKLTAVDVGPLLKDLELLGGVTGTGVLVTLKAAMRGSSLRTLDGSASLSIRDGQLVGADVLKLISQARAMAAQMRGRSQAPPEAPVSAAPGDKTPFATLSATATIDDGIARNTDLVLESGALQATGSGTADLERATLDYVLRARTPQTGEVTIPIAVSGPFSKLSYRVDAGTMIRDAASQEIKKQIQKGLGSLFKKKP
jgi:uncharacterized protein involved in outer membrane biogenesis